MGNNITELVFVLDRSGSMRRLTEDTIGGFNSMIDRQKQLEGKVIVSTVLFSSDSTVLHDRVDINEIQPLTEKEYFAVGNTALLDALGGAIHHIGNVHKYARPEDVPEQTIFIITTDGMENASHIYTAEKVRSMIKHEEDKYGWEFLFLGANIDAVRTAERYGIRKERASNYRADSKGTRDMYACVSETIGITRCTKIISDDWMKPLDEEK